MKRRFSFSHLLHKDRLMMVVSLVLAIIIWVLVVYGQGHTQERVISGIPVSVTLDPWVSEALKLQIVDGADATATVQVRGARSVVGLLTSQSITVTADTKDVLKEGTYTIPIRVISSGDYDILSLVGDDGANPTIKITCDVIVEKTFSITSDDVELPHLSLSDKEKYRFGNPSPSGAAIQEGMVTVSGPKSEISRITRVSAVISEEQELSETTSFTANLVAYDENDQAVKSVTFLNAEDGKVNVVVPIMEYHVEELALNVKNAPADAESMVSVSPATIELWAIPSALDDYLAVLQQKLTVDFEKEQANGEVVARPIEMEKTSGILLKTEEVPVLTLDFSKRVSRTVDILLSETNVEVRNCPEGFTFGLEQSVLSNVVICGDAVAIADIDPAELRVVVDAAGLPSGYITVKARIESNEESLWVYYGDSGYELQIAIVQP